jgi:hypothetical protein
MRTDHTGHTRLSTLRRRSLNAIGRSDQLEQLFEPLLTAAPEDRPWQYTGAGAGRTRSRSRISSLAACFGGGGGLATQSSPSACSQALHHPLRAASRRQPRPARDRRRTAADRARTPRRLTSIPRAKPPSRRRLLLPINHSVNRTVEDGPKCDCHRYVTAARLSITLMMQCCVGPCAPVASS